MTDVKAKLAGFDRIGLLDVVRDLYAAHKENQTFLHARFGLVEDVLESCKQTIDRWVAPDVYRKQVTISVAKAKQAIADYKKAVGDPAGMAELTVYFCEQATRFCNAYGNDDESYYSALVRMFEQALIVTKTLPDSLQVPLIDRLDTVRNLGRIFGYGVDIDMDSSFARYVDGDD